MSTNKTDSDLNKLVNEASTLVGEQQRQAEEKAAAQIKKAQKSRSPVMPLLVMVVFIGIGIVQFPRFSQPYAWPDADKDPAVVEADIETIAAVIEVYRAATGKYPASIEDIKLPGALAEVIKQTQLKYAVSSESYALDWALPHWTVAFDGQVRKAKIEKRL